MKIYISGKITGLEFSEAFEMFEKAEEELKNHPDIISTPHPINPMKLTHKENATWNDYMKEDIGALLECEGIYMLKNWGASRGARVEYAIAKEMGIAILYQN